MTRPLGLYEELLTLGLTREVAETNTYRKLLDQLPRPMPAEFFREARVAAG
ncbi:MAG TPA: hypothetical protein VMN04_13050 [Thermoanaerobaculia bacterium]|nr:hypothetical protein [Thermoanaerobaculia bacterium]